MTGTGENRKKRDYYEKRDIILEGASKVFIEKGFSASSMDEIADVAGVSKRTVYNHFFSKENLFQTIAADFLRERDENRHIEYSQADTVNVQLKEFIKAELYLVDDPVRRGLTKLLTSTFLIDVEVGNTALSLYQPYSGFIAWLNAAKDNKKLSFETPEPVARIFYGLIEGCLIWPALLSGEDSLKNAEPMVDEIITVFISRYGGR